MNQVVEALSLLIPYDIDKQKIRKGPHTDGGYILVDDIVSSQVIISYGIGLEYRFDQEMAEGGNDVYMFDHTIEDIQATNSKMHFFCEGVAGHTDPFQNLFSIEDHLQRHQIGGDRLILKMDVEGAEFDALKTLPDEILARFEQIVLEVHGLNCLDDHVYRGNFCEVFRKLNRFFTLFHVHANNCDGQNGLHIVSGIPVSSILELSYVRSSSVHRRSSQTLYPTTIDYPNTGNKDKLLWFFPFLPTFLTLENFAACEERIEFCLKTQSRSSTTQLSGYSLVNVAKGKPATQSSFSQWSGESESARAVSGSIPDAFAFHTEVEDCPWWQVDLLVIFPIESIVVHNRLDMLAERAKTLKVEVSDDNANWRLVHAGLAFFSGGESGPPLTLRLDGRICARYVRISLTEREYLHLAQVEVFVRAEILEFMEFRERHGLTNLRLRAEDKAKPWWLYSIEMNSLADATKPLIGLKINHNGRFGNLLQQFANAIIFAERAGLKYVQLGRHELIDPTDPISVGNLTLLPSHVTLPPEGTFLSGVFLHTAEFAPLLSPNEAEQCHVVREIIRPHLSAGILPLDSDQFKDELTVHIRAGDIFDGEQTLWSWYRQPPLAFYILVMTRLLASGTISRVRVVFEDRGNPCVNALEQYLTEKRIAFRMQSGTLAEDLSVLIDAPHLAFGFGTFGYAVCKLSKRIETVHFFAPELSGYATAGGGSYRMIPVIDKVYSIHDRGGGYIKVGDWKNTPEQRELMCSYPIEALEVEELSRHVN